MVLGAQGTVRVKQEGRQITVMINPICDYKVHHKEKNYTVFVSDDGQTHRMLPAETWFEVDESVRTLLVQAAFSQVKVEIAVEEVAGTPTLYRVTGLQLPSPVSK